MGTLFMTRDRHGHEATPNNSLAALTGLWGLEGEGDGLALLLDG